MKTLHGSLHGQPERERKKKKNPLKKTSSRPTPTFHLSIFQKIPGSLYPRMILRSRTSQTSAALAEARADASSKEGGADGIRC